MDVKLLKELTKDRRVDVQSGEFMIVSTDADHNLFYLYQFEKSKVANQAKKIDFIVADQSVPTRTILSDESRRSHLVSIDLELTTMSDAEKARKEACKTALEIGAKCVLTEVSKLFTTTLTTTYDPATVLAQIDIDSLVASMVAAAPAISPVPVTVPENMCNRMVQYEVTRVAKGMGFTVKSNTSVGDTETQPFSQYYRSRPDLIIYDKEVPAAVVVHTTVQTEEMDEQDHPHVTISAGVAECKLRVGNNVGQLLAGMDKAAGDVAYEHLTKNIPAAKKKFDIIEIYGLLCDYATRSSQVYKLQLNFLKNTSTLLQGNEEVPLATGMTGILATLCAMRSPASGQLSN